MYKPRYRYPIITPDTAIIGNGYYASIYEVTLREVEVTENNNDNNFTNTYNINNGDYNNNY